MTRSSRCYTTPQLRSTLKLGMPQLGFTGLSDAWLLQFLGHLHWQMIEASVNQASSEWADGAGQRLYASFVAIEVQGAVLAAGREGDVLHCESRLERLGVALYHSEHKLSLGIATSLSATAQLCTVFVRRARVGDNHSFQKASDGPTVARGPVPSRRRPALLEAYHHYRSRLGAEPARETQTFPVVPLEDFNGAGMVYFANFARYVDRADWLVAGADASRPWRLHRRRIFCYGNLNIGDSVAVDHLERTGRLSRTRLRRVGSGGPIAYCETERR